MTLKNNNNQNFVRLNMKRKGNYKTKNISTKKRRINREESLINLDTDNTKEGKIIFYYYSIILINFYLLILRINTKFYYC